jgi:L-2,4-diaminobutyric acid acetyltransferase
VLKTFERVESPPKDRAAGTEPSVAAVETSLRIRATTAADGATIAGLVAATYVLEPLSGYAYVMLADLFGDACAIAELGGTPSGCVVALRPPRSPHALFVWQIGVHPRAQRRGIGLTMLESILARPCNADIHEVLATVAPTNSASEAMFRAFAARRDAAIERIGGYAADLFPEAHEPERLFRIGPLKGVQLENL